eukprot:2391933-Amphidinium_carterae.1
MEDQRHTISRDGQCWGCRAGQLTSSKAKLPGLDNNISQLGVAFSTLQTQVTGQCHAVERGRSSVKNPDR